MFLRFVQFVLAPNISPYLFLLLLSFFSFFSFLFFFSFVSSSPILLRCSLSACLPANLRACLRACVPACNPACLRARVPSCLFPAAWRKGRRTSKRGIFVSAHRKQSHPLFSCQEVKTQPWLKKKSS